MNKVILIGRLTRDVEMRYSKNSDTKIARYTLAVNRPFRQNGEQQGADFLPCVAFGKTAEYAEKYLSQGMRVAIEGRIQTGSYTNGEAKKVYTTEVVIERQEFLEKRAGNSQPNTDASANGEDGYLNIPDGIDEELPFN